MGIAPNQTKVALSFLCLFYICCRSWGPKESGPTDITRRAQVGRHLLGKTMSPLIVHWSQSCCILGRAHCVGLCIRQDSQPEHTEMQRVYETGGSALSCLFLSNMRPTAGHDTVTAGILGAHFLFLPSRKSPAASRAGGSLALLLPNPQPH